MPAKLVQRQDVVRGGLAFCNQFQKMLTKFQNFIINSKDFCTNKRWLTPRAPSWQLLNKEETKLGTRLSPLALMQTCKNSWQ
jgi:hypothetical protein